MEIHSQTFTVSEASKATGVKADSIKNWTKQGVMIGHRTIGGGGSAGRKRTYTFRNILEIAVAGALLDLGIKSVPEAFRGANEFAHTGHGKTGYAESIRGTSARDPGLPYHFTLGDTYLYMSGEHCYITLHREDVVPVSIIQQALRRPIGYIALNLTKVFANVCNNIPDCPDYRNVLDAAYPEDATA